MYDVNKNTAPDNILKLFSRIIVKRNAQILKERPKKTFKDP